jgi:hypothetical protein
MLIEKYDHDLWLALAKKKYLSEKWRWQPDSNR